MRASIYAIILGEENVPMLPRTVEDSALYIGQRAVNDAARAMLTDPGQYADIHLVERGQDPKSYLDCPTYRLSIGPRGGLQRENF